ncbi:hypothetical protein AADZ86_08320 [Colwelliaceae bacterium BS250]
MRDSSLTIASEANLPINVPTKPKYLFNNKIDFLCLGGLSFFLLPILFFVPTEHLPLLGFISYIIADFVNHPHFAFSYQLFYRDFITHLKSKNSNIFVFKLIFAGLIAPIFLLIFFIYCIYFGEKLLIGYSVNAMFLLVGWHYAKQGYGMLMLDSVLKKSFFNDLEKKLLRYNAHFCWFFLWVYTNSLVEEKNYIEITYYTFSLPESLITLMGILALTSSLAVMRCLYMKFKGYEGDIPLNGIIAYYMSIYLWLIGRVNPAFILFVPALHSLQYSIVVYRLELNRQSDLGFKARRKVLNFALFITFAIAIGYLGFRSLPLFFEASFTLNDDIYNGSIFLFCCWIFINIHHYLIDNILWRKDNKITNKHLFS